MKNKPIVIDLFCGAGGESQGIHWAMGDDIKLFAVNHWERAVESHSANFPADESICQDIQTVNPAKLVGGQEVELMWASPECTHFSVARGGKPMDDQSRCSPWDILRWLDMVKVKRLIIENVPEFVTWGPLDDNNRPVKELKGTYFSMFINNIQTMGYEVQCKVLNAADFGAPTIRRRLFIQAVKRGCGKSLCWPSATHGPMSAISADLFDPVMAPWVPARDIIDWSIPCIPLEMRSRPLSTNTMRRIENGIRKYWGEWAEPFLVRYNGGSNRHHFISDPVPVLDTSNRYGLVEPLLLSNHFNNYAKPSNNPCPTITTANAIGVVEPLFIPQQSCGEVRPVSNPLSTISTAGAISIVQPLTVEFRGKNTCRPTDEPLSAVATSGAHHGVIEPLVMEYYGNGQCKPVSKPVGTVTTKDRFVLLEGSQLGIGFRMLQPHELAAAQSFPKDYYFSGNRADQVKQIGNAVCPKVAEALVKAGA